MRLGFFGISVLWAAFLASAGQRHEEEDFVVEKFDFEWTVAEVGDSRLIINKTHETTRVLIRSGRMMADSIWLSPDEAEKVGKALADVDKYYLKMRNAETDMSDRVEAAGYTVTFHFSKKYGFSVRLAPAERFALSSLSLERGEAKAFAPHLMKARAMAGFIDRKIKF
ncbi:MAG: hypothetical protein FJ291_05555 [Planctomycetes bacterium]|nr:hypothetical protein [Planctomycetota bacterium]